MTTHNVLALIEIYRVRAVATVRTPNGIVFMGMRRLTKDQRQSLLDIPQTELDAAMRWQR